FVEFWLVVEGVDVARSAVHEQKDYALCLGGELRLFRGERVLERRRSVGCDGLFVEEAIAGEEAGQCQRGECAACLPKEFAAGAMAKTVGGLVGHGWSRWPL